MMKSKSFHLWKIVIVLSLFSLACNLVGNASPTPASTEETPNPTPTVAQTAPDPTNDTPTPEITEAPPVQGEDGCTLRAAYVTDVTIPDDTEMEKGEKFTKIWRIQNSGTCTWEQGTKFVHISGEKLGAPDSVAIGSTAPEAKVDIDVEMTAPQTYGTYRSNWQLEAPDGTRYGGTFYVQIVVPAPITPTPTEQSGTPPTDFIGTVAADCKNVAFSWTGAKGEGSYRIEGPSLNETLPADTESYTWENPPEGSASVTLIALDNSDAEIGRVSTTVNIACGDGQPDLIVDAIDFDPGNPTAFLPLKVKIKIRNQGNADSGSFVVRWWGGKNFSNASCEWTLGSGLAVGETDTLECDTYRFNSPYNNLETKVYIDANASIAESDETNNILEQTINVVKPVTVYNFVEKASVASWSAGDPSENLSWNGNTSDSEGFVRAATGKLETGGTIRGECLQTHPKWVDNGWISGTYIDLYQSGYTVQEGDRFYATVGFLQGAAQGNVTFKVLLRTESSGNIWIAEVNDKYDSKLKTISIDLSEYAGQKADALLKVEAGASSEQDWACWIKAVIYRYP